MMQANPEMFVPVRENTKAMWTQLDPRSEWVRCTSSPDNPIMIVTLKPEVIANRKLTIVDQEQLLQEAVDEVCVTPITREER